MCGLALSKLSSITFGSLYESLFAMGLCLKERAANKVHDWPFSWWTFRIFFIIVCSERGKGESEALGGGGGGLVFYSPDPGHLRPVIIKLVGRIFEISDSNPKKRKMRKVPLNVEKY